MDEKRISMTLRPKPSEIIPPLLSTNFLSLKKELTEESEPSTEQLEIFAYLYSKEKKEEALNFLKEAEELASYLDYLKSTNKAFETALKSIEDNTQTYGHPENPKELIILHMVDLKEDSEFEESLVNEILYRVSEFNRDNMDYEEHFNFYNSWAQFLNRLIEIEKNKKRDTTIEDAEIK